MDGIEEVKVFKHLQELGLCKRCCLIYLGDTYANFEDPDSYIENQCLAPICKKEEQPEEKKQKLNPCMVCLNILTDDFVDTIWKHPAFKKLTEYDSDTYRFALTLPGNVYIREVSMSIYIREKFPDFYKDKLLNNNVSKALKFTLKAKSKELNRKYDEDGLLAIKVEIDYKDWSKEVKTLGRVDPKFRFNPNRDDFDKVFSRNNLKELQRVDATTFKRFMPVPPNGVDYGAVLKEVEIFTMYIYLGGRYNKYSRNVGQTPWLQNDDELGLGNNLYLSGNVRDEIVEGVTAVLGHESIDVTFCASGREDFDVRCLGKGRPFYLQIANAKKTKITKDECRRIEEYIEKKSPFVNVNSIQMVDKKEIREIKTGEELKAKIYTALCIVLTCDYDLDDIINCINNLQSFDIEQTTPVRVLHRRPLLVRKKAITSLKARKVEGRDNLFELDLETQAGTYVKEFVHGDLGRTTPSLCDILGISVDIILLDVMAIKLDWPPAQKTQ